VPEALRRRAGYSYGTQESALNAGTAAQSGDPRMEYLFFDALYLIAAIAMVFVVCRAGLWIRQCVIEADIMKNGIAANADILSIHRDNHLHRYNVKCVMVVRFNTRDGQEVQSRLVQVMSVREYKRFASGTGVTIKYAASRPQRIVLYDRPLVLGEH